MNDLDQLEQELNKTPKLLPFRVMRRCPKCAHGIWRVPGWVVRWFDLPYANFKVVWCKGHMEPQVEHQMDTIIGTIGKTVTMPCAGIIEDHLHVQCSRCGYWFLMETSDAHA